MKTLSLNIFLITTMISVVSFTSFANTHTSIILTPTKFTELLVHNHPRFKELDLQSQGKDFAKKIKDPFGYTYNSSINTVTEELSNGVNAKNNDGSTTSVNHLLKRITATGKYTSNLQLQHTIPLLQDKNGINTTLAMDLAEIDIEIDTLNKQKSINTFITTELKQLINLVYNQERLKILNARNTVDIEELEIITDKYNENLVDKTDVLLQESTIASNQIDITSTKKTIDKITSTIQTTLNIANFDAEFDLYTTRHNAMIIPQVESLLVQQVKEIEIKKRERELQSLHNQEKEKVDFSLRTTFTSGNQNTLGSSLSKSSPRFGVGLEVSLPFGNEKEYYQIMSKNNEISIIKEQIKQDNINNTSTLKNIISDIDKTLKLLTIAKDQIQINQQRYEEYQSLYDDNNADLEFVLNANTALINSRLRYIEYLKNYHLLLLDFQNAGL